MYQIHLEKEKMMANAFREFVEAEVNEIMSSMDERCRKDPDLCRKVAIEWIEKNAEVFRKQWNKMKKLQEIKLGH